MLTPLDFESALIWSIAGLLRGIMRGPGLSDGCYGEPGLVCMHVFLGGSGILDKAVSCLWPWREVITGPTSVGPTWSWEATFRSAVPWLHHACVVPCQHILPTSCSVLSALPHATLLNGPFLYTINSPMCSAISVFLCWKNAIYFQSTQRFFKRIVQIFSSGVTIFFCNRNRSALYHLGIQGK